MFEIFAFGFLGGSLLMLGFLAHYNTIRYMEQRKRKRTNADKIREMTDIELAAVIMCPEAGNQEECEVYDNFAGCNVCCYEWLRKEADDE